MKKFLIVLALIIVPSLSFASSFPPFQKNDHIEFTANGTFTAFATSTKTIVSIGVLLDPTKTMQAWLYCGEALEGNEIFETHGQSSVRIENLNFLCQNVIKYKVSGYGGLAGHFDMQYVDYDSVNQLWDKDPIFLSDNAGMDAIQSSAFVVPYKGVFATFSPAGVLESASPSPLFLSTVFGSSGMGFKFLLSTDVSYIFSQCSSYDICVKYLREKGALDYVGTFDYDVTSGVISNLYYSPVEKSNIDYVILAIIVLIMISVASFTLMIFKE